MNEIFNIRRFYNVVKAETLSFRRHYLFYLIAAAAYTLSCLLISRHSFNPDGFAVVAILLMIISPFMLYNNVFHRVKGVNYTLLPASNLEKWLAFWFQNVVIVPLILVVLWLALSALESVIFGHSIHFLDGFGEHVHGGVLGILGLQAIAMVGTMAFRRLKWLKTLGAIFILQVVSLIVANLFMYQFDLKSFIIEVQTANVTISPYSWLLIYIKIIAYLVFPFGLWLVSFFKLQEQEL